MLLNRGNGGILWADIRSDSVVIMTNGGHYYAHTAEDDFVFSNRYFGIVMYADGKRIHQNIYTIADHFLNDAEGSLSRHEANLEITAGSYSPEQKFEMDLHLVYAPPGASYYRDPFPVCPASFCHIDGDNIVGNAMGPGFLDPKSGTRPEWALVDWPEYSTNRYRVTTGIYPPDVGELIHQSAYQSFLDGSPSEPDKETIHYRRFTLLNAMAKTTEETICFDKEIQHG